MENLLLNFLHFDFIAVKWLGIKLFDTDLYELLARFGFNLVMTFVIVRIIYYRYRKDSEYMFAYTMFSIIIFFVIFLLNNVKLSIGFAFGLFAVFSILRYRTSTVPIREMTYLFVIITISMLNALANKKVSYAELVFTNLAIVFAVYWLEMANSKKQLMSIYIDYERIENVSVEKYPAMISDLCERTGLDIVRFDVLRINYMSDSAKLKVFYRPTSNDTYLTDNEIENPDTNAD